ncbi:PP2C family protein-serine/threonine phosphatase, partial [Vibrio sp. FNV 38]|nr:PP2C family protein-serine/threonine phosphatase [Vibrio sp. FNV 38]
ALPREFPPFPEIDRFDIYASMKMAREVGGDFYDFFLLDDGKLAFLIADVSGKGIPAALFMMIAKILIKNRVLNGDSPSRALETVNEQLLDGNDAGMFVTVWLAVIEISTGKGIVSNAGHEHPAIKRSGGSFELVKYRHSPAVAAFDDLTFEEHEFQLYPGDKLFIYTDGVT